MRLPSKRTAAVSAAVATAAVATAAAIAVATVVGQSAAAGDSAPNIVPAAANSMQYPPGAGQASAATPTAPRPVREPGPQPPLAQCEEAQQGLFGAFYRGPAASATYESIFRRGFALPHLDTHVPQSITTWPKWNSEDEAILVVGMYRKVAQVEENSYLVAVDPRTGAHLGTVEVEPGHLGGIAIAGGFLFGQHGDRPAPAREQVRRYRLDALKAAIGQAAASGGRPYLQREPDLQTISGAGFMYAYKGEIWAGHYNHDAADTIHRYRVDSEGTLRAKGAGYEAPARTQGILVTSDRLIFNVSRGQKQGWMVVTDRRHALDDAVAACFAAPSMGEGMTRVGNRIFVVYEGGSYRYPAAVNRLGYANEGSLSALRALPR